MSKKFKAFETGIRISTPGLAADPAPGKVGMIYQNTTRNVLRYCTNVGPDVWIDLFIQAGTVNDSTMRWDVAEGRWKENADFLTSGSTLYSADADTQNDIAIQGGDTTDLSIRGSDIYIQPGEGDAGTGYIFIDTSLLKPSELTSGPGRPVALEAGDTTDAAGLGGDLSLSAGAGPLGMGNLNLSGYTSTLTVGGNHTSNVTGTTNINSTGNFSISAPKIGLGASAAVDPLGDLLGDLYYNTTFGRWKYYDNTDWYWLDVNKYNIPLVTIDVFEASAPGLPVNTTTDLIDGITVTDGMTALLPNLNPKIQQATVVGTLITWEDLSLGIAKDGTPVGGDQVHVLSGNVSAELNLMYNATLDEWKNITLPSSVGADTLLRYNGTLWAVAPITRLSVAGELYLENESTNDALPGHSLTLRAGNKISGTGDGGSVLIASGTTAGGSRGSILLEGLVTNLAPTTDIADPASGDIAAHTINSLFHHRFSNGTGWQRFDSADINGEITGFANLVDSSIGWVDLTRTLTLTVPVAAQYFIQGYRTELTADATLVLPDTNQTNYVVIDSSGVLTSSTTFDPYDQSSNKALVAIVQWNVNEQVAHSVIDARTLVTIDWANRAYIKKADGILAKGLALSLTGSGFDGTVDTDYQFNIAFGSLEFPDRSYPLAAKSVASSEIAVMFNDIDAINVATATALPMTYDVIPQWNQLSGTWQEVDVADGYYYTQWIVSSRNGEIYSLMGQAQHETLQGAINVDWSSIQTAAFDKTELAPLHKVIFRYDTAFTNSAESIIVEVENLFDLDAAKVLSSQQLASNEYRNTKISGGGTIVFTPATNSLAWDADAFVNVPGISQARNAISAGSVVLAADNSVAYVVLNRNEGGAATLTVSTSTFSALAKLAGNANDIYIIAHRVDGKVYFGDTLALFEIALLDNTTDADLLTISGAGNAVKMTYSLVRDTDVEAGDIHVVGIGTVAALSSNAASSGALGVDFNAEIDTGNLKITYTTTSTGSGAVLRYSIDSWKH